MEIIQRIGYRYRIHEEGEGVATAEETDADLAAAFAPFGEVVSAKVYVDRTTGESKGLRFRIVRRR